MKFEIRNRFSGGVQFTAEINCSEDAPVGVKRGLAVKWALKNGADLRRADLRGAYLRRAFLPGADFAMADLTGADFAMAELRRAGLRGAELGGAGLRGADLRRAYLRGAYLRGADLEGAYLRGADLEGAKLPHFQLCPQKGAFIAYKKLIGSVITLEIPAEARRTSSLVGRKCRAEFVRVLKGYGVSRRGGRYVAGEIYRPDVYDDDIRVECTNGVHFFMTKEEAEEWT